jgi:hypothetical protein
MMFVVVQAKCLEHFQNRPWKFPEQKKSLGSTDGGLCFQGQVILGLKR